MDFAKVALVADQTIAMAVGPASSAGGEILAEQAIVRVVAELALASATEGGVQAGQVNGCRPEGPGRDVIAGLHARSLKNRMTERQPPGPVVPLRPPGIR
jgi:hypothetical protein